MAHWLVNQSTIADRGVLRPTHIEVDLARLTANYRAIQVHVAPAAVMPILKANAYGHGLVEVARHMQALGAPYLGVAFLEEGILLREAGVTTPILVLGGIIGNQIPLFLEYDLTLTASSVDKLGQIEAAARAMGVRAKVHLKIDTGMERIGVHYYSAAALLEASLACTHFEVEGIFSHFANADMPDPAYSHLQLARFEGVLDFYARRGLPPPPLRHMANSAALARFPQAHFDMVRAGLLLYGVYPSADVPRTVAVRPTLSWKSRVVYFKVVRPGTRSAMARRGRATTPCALSPCPSAMATATFAPCPTGPRSSSAGGATRSSAASAWINSWSTSNGTQPTTATRSSCWARTPAARPCASKNWPSGPAPCRGKF